MPFTVATYNTLANAYIKPAWYPNTPPWMLLTEYRVPALLRHIVGFKADILCLQEIEADTFEALGDTLRPLGYAGYLAQKAQNKPDGCALFFRTGAFAPLKAIRLDFQDSTAGEASSGHVAQLAVLHKENRTLGIANTHLKWDPPGIPREKQFGYRQVCQLLGACETLASAGAAWIVCGDLNVTPESDVVATLTNAGFSFTHRPWARAYTCNSNAKAKTIDYLFYNTALSANPVLLPPVEDHTPLPGPDQPSDHVAVEAHFEWVEGKGSPLDTQSPTTSKS